MQTRYQIAVNLYNGGWFPPARAEFETCLKTATNPFMRLKIHSSLGQCCAAMRQSDLSRSHFEAAVKINETSQDGQLITAFCFSRLGKSDQALAIAAKIIKTDPYCKRAYQLISAAYQQMGNQEKVKETQRRFADAMHKQTLMLLSKITVNVESIEFEQVNDPECERKNLLAKAIFHLSIKKYEEALFESFHLLTLVPHHHEAMYVAACCLKELNHEKDAKVFVTEALKLKPDYREAKKLLEQLTNT